MLHALELPIQQNIFFETKKKKWNDRSWQAFEKLMLELGPAMFQLGWEMKVELRYAVHCL